jgi:hypothetical protein
LPIGAEVGWLGFPAIAQYTLCFFSGNVSAWQEWRNAYLIDGVAINGVSGGPVIYSTPTDGVQIVGCISAYRANRATGEALPGLSIAQDYGDGWGSEISPAADKLRGASLLRWCGAQDLNLHGLAATGS